MAVRLTEDTIAECQSQFNLSYHVPFAYQCQKLVGFKGKNVSEVGGSLPKEFVFDYLEVKSWSAIEAPDYESFLQHVEGTPHQGSVIHHLSDTHSKLGFQNRELVDYNLFFACVEDLPPEHYQKYDLIFSLSAFEHIQKLPQALEKMYLALKPSGRLFSMFSPIWSAHDGHHLPNVVDQKGREFNFYRNNPIPPWGHLLMRPAELCRYLYQITDKETADLMVYYVYHSPQINRLFTEDYVEFFQQSSFSIERIDLTFQSQASLELQASLEKFHPGRRYFSNNGLLVILEKSGFESKTIASSASSSDEDLLKNKSNEQVKTNVSPASVATHNTSQINSTNSMETQLYTKNFYVAIQEGSRQSAQVVVPLVMDLVQPKSLVDLGCGAGNWLAAFSEFGVQDYLGIDGDYVDLETLKIPQDKFLAHDLKHPLKLDKKYDLAMSVEVAEHLPSELAETFVQSLTQLSSLIMFSAAIPNQGGTGHFNEQWLEYWVEIFQKQGYIPVDCLRDKIWGNVLVEPWYSQNLIFFVQANCLHLYPRLAAELPNTNKSVLSRVHPRIYLNSLSMLQQAMTNPDPLGVVSLVKQYQSGKDESALAALRQFRQQVANFWLNSSVHQLKGIYESDFGKAHRLILDSGIYRELLTDDEQVFINQIAQQIAQGFKDYKTIPCLLVLTLYCQAEQLTWEFDLDHIPEWLLDTYFKFITKRPLLFRAFGDAENYYWHMKRWVDYVYEQILHYPDSSLVQQAATYFTKLSNFMSLYFSQENLKEIYTKRGSIIEFTLKHQGCQIDYEFPERSPNRNKIRLGILKNHYNPQTETFLTIPAFEHLDRDQFEIILYATRSNQHPLEQYCEKYADKFVYLPPDLSDQVALIRADDLDMLLLGTNTTIQVNDICLLAAHRLARLQATLYSSPVTTGLRHVDYYISGDLTEPQQGAQSYYTEQLITLDGTGYCFNYVSEPAATQVGLTREALGIASDAIVYISGANFFKIIPELREAWTKIIADVPNSVLVLYPFSPSWSLSYASQEFTENFHVLFDKYGIARERLIILDTIPIRADVKEHLRLGDVYLDSFPYTGSLSASDPLEVGLPPIVMSGQTLRSRQGSALLRDLQMPELIAENEEEYIQLAVELGVNPGLRHQRHEQIQQEMQNNPGFFDSLSYSTQIGLVFQKLFEDYQAQKIQEDYRLRQVNFIALPDWTQPEDSLLRSLTDLMRKVLTQPDCSQTTLLIAIDEVDQEVADELVGSAIMYLLTEEGLEINGEEPEISLVGDLSRAKWQLLLPFLAARIPLAQEDPVAVAQLQKATSLACKEPLPLYEAVS